MIPPRALLALFPLALAACGARSELLSGAEPAMPADAARPSLDAAPDAALGDAVAPDVATLVDAPVVPPRPARRVAAGTWHSAAVDSDSVARAWGRNVVGQLGDGTTVDRFVPTVVSTLPGRVVEVAAGGLSTCARDAAGSVSCWGTMTNAGFRPPPPPPRRVAALTDATQIAAGSGQACAVRADGTVACWGVTGFEQRGGECRQRVVSEAATPVAGVAGATQVAVGDGFACARGADGAVTCFGCNAHNQLGRTGGTSAGVVVVAGISRAVRVAAGGHHACALLADGAVWCWGSLVRASGRHESVAAPERVEGLGDVVDLAAGGDDTCAVRRDGTVACMGTRTVLSGEGDACAGMAAAEPYVLEGIDAVAEVALGGTHGCARRVDDSVWCWGCNAFGALGDGTTRGSATPVPAAR